MEELLNLIPSGRENAIHLTDLAKKLGLSIRRTQEKVYEARRSGAVILSDASGYFQPESHDEVVCFAGSYKRRMRTSRMNFKSTSAELKKFPGQISF